MHSLILWEPQFRSRLSMDAWCLYVYTLCILLRNMHVHTLGNQEVISLGKLYQLDWQQTSVTQNGILLDNYCLWSRHWQKCHEIQICGCFIYFLIFLWIWYLCIFPSGLICPFNFFLTRFIMFSCGAACSTVHLTTCPMAILSKLKHSFLESEVNL